MFSGQDQNPALSDGHMPTSVALSKPELMALYYMLSDSCATLPENAWLRFMPGLPVMFFQYTGGTNSQGAMVTCIWTPQPNVAGGCAMMIPSELSKSRLLS